MTAALPLPDTLAASRDPHASASPFPRPLLAGRRPVSALWWPAGWLSPLAERRDVLRHWTPGATAHRFSDGLLLRLPAPVTMDCAGLTAWPLQRLSGVLCSADVSSERLATLPLADAWLVVAGQAHALNLSAAQVEDVSRWLAADLPRIEPLDLRQPEPERILVMDEARPLAKVLGPSVPQSMAPETRALLETLQQAAQRRQGKVGARTPATAIGDRHRRLLSGTAAAAAVTAGGLVVAALIAGAASAAAPLSLSAAAVGGLLGLLGGFGGIARRGAQSRSSGSAGQSAAPSGTGSTGQRPGDGLRERLKRAPILPQQWRNWMARAALASGLSHALGMRQSAYLRKMLRMFDDGDLNEALRHALPLGGQAGSLGQAFGAPGRRQDLHLSANGTGPSASIHLSPDLEQHLRELYRRTAQDLEAKGRIDEAVFVHAELLHDRAHALELLERHQRFQQAAELAFGWDMPAAAIIRLYALAGDWQRAERVARRDGAWEEAVTLLESRWPEAGRRLRQRWAETLADQGRWLDAARVLWLCTDARETVQAWIESAEQVGGLVSTRTLAWRALGWPDTLDARVPEITALHCDPSAQRARAALVDELLRLPGEPTPAMRRLALMLAGPTLADQSVSGPSLSAQRLGQLVALTQDAALKADLPSAGFHTLAPALPPLAQQTRPLTGWVPEPGLHPVLDAVCMAHDELLVALGEAGAVRVDAVGRRLDHFPVPAEVLVVAEDGCSALALARRDAVWRVTRLDLMHRRAVDLGLHRLDAFADRFDGGGWTVAVGTRVQVLDVQAPGLREVLWQVADLPGPVLHIARGMQQETWVMQSSPNAQQWSYTLPQRRLQSRDELPPLNAQQLRTAETEGSPRLLAGGRGVLEFRPASPGSSESWLCTLAGHEMRLGSFDRSGMQVLKADGQWLLMASLGAPVEENGAPRRLIRLHQINGPCKMTWHWPADARLRVRAQGQQWLVFDSQGRIATVDMQTGAQTARCC